MYFSSDEKTNVIIGEAAMNLIDASQEVNVELLISELQVMATSEADEKRLEQLQHARQWLMAFKTIGARANGSKPRWLCRAPDLCKVVQVDSSVGEKPVRIRF